MIGGVFMASSNSSIAGLGPPQTAALPAELPSPAAERLVRT
jgi:hypothetical protein